MAISLRRWYMWHAPCWLAGHLYRYKTYHYPDGFKDTWKECWRCGDLRPATLDRQPEIG